MTRFRIASHRIAMIRLLQESYTERDQEGCVFAWGGGPHYHLTPPLKSSCAPALLHTDAVPCAGRGITLLLPHPMNLMFSVFALPSFLKGSHDAVWAQMPVQNSMFTEWNE